MTKRVTFRPFADVLRMHPSTYPDESLRPSLYYSKAELDAIDLELKSTAALFLALRGHDDGTNRSPGACIVQLDTDDALRGLEHRLFPTRQARRYLVRRTVLKYQRVISSRTDVSSTKKIEAIAKAASKLSVWSNEVSQETARLDFLRVQDAAGYPIPAYTKQVTSTEFFTHKKTIGAGNLGASANITAKLTPKERFFNAKAA
mmetsp:Transcript_22490/g.53057  ORF Transcript_22490/g.53057 Transcript_22490/m.53057 type:complete len:203 (+) Transcript_22490:381-989(+)